MNCKYYCGTCDEHYFRRYTNINEKHDKCGEFSAIVWGNSEAALNDHVDSQLADGEERSAR